MIIQLVLEEWLDKWDYNFSSHDDYRIDSEIAAWKTVLRACHKKHEGCLQDLRVRTKPSAEQAVVANKKFEVGSIKLVPVTPNVTYSKKDVEPVPPQSVPLANMQCAIDGKTAAIFASLYKSVSDDSGEAKSSGHVQKKEFAQFVAPFWFVGTTPDPNRANCRLTQTTLKVFSDEYKVMIIENKDKLEKGEQLLLYVPEGA